MDAEKQKLLKAKTDVGEYENQCVNILLFLSLTPHISIQIYTPNLIGSPRAKFIYNRWASLRSPEKPCVHLYNSSTGGNFSNQTDKDDFSKPRSIVCSSSSFIFCSKGYKVSILFVSVLLLASIVGFSNVYIFFISVPRTQECFSNYFPFLHG